MVEVYGIFDIREPDRIRYVGLTQFDAAYRLRKHWSQATSTTRKLPILLWLRKRIKSDVAVRVLDIADDSEHMKSLEQFHIAQYREFDMADLNVTDGGETANGYVHDQSYREWQSDRARGENNGSAKLTEEQALEVLRSDLPARFFVEKYGISKQLVSAIRCGTAWAHLVK